MRDASYLYRRLHHAAGNALRFASSPWRQRYIEVGEATTLFGCSFGDGGWHHIRETLREYDTDPHIHHTETTLYRYLTRFCPTSICDLACPPDERAASLPLFVYPWGTFRIGECHTEKAPLTSRFCGPSSDAFVADEFERIKALYSSLARVGYRPWTYGHSFVGGTFLVARDGSRRFVTLQGNHRLAILAHLGQHRLHVRDAPGCHPELREQDIERWPLVSSGECPLPRARRIFRFFFEADGHHVARALDADEAPGFVHSDTAAAKGSGRVRLL